MVVRVKPTPTRFPTNSLYTPMCNTPLHPISSVCLPWGALLLSCHSANGSISQEESYFTYLVTRLHLPHARVVRLHMHKVYIVAPTHAGLSWCLDSSLSLSVRLSIQGENIDVTRTRYHAGLLFYLVIKKEAWGLMVSRVRPAPTRFPTNIRYVPVDSTFVHFASGVQCR